MGSLFRDAAHQLAAMCIHRYRSAGSRVPLGLFCPAVPFSLGVFFSASMTIYSLSMDEIGVLVSNPFNPVPSSHHPRRRTSDAHDLRARAVKLPEKVSFPGRDRRKCPPILSYHGASSPLHHAWIYCVPASHPHRDQMKFKSPLLTTTESPPCHVRPAVYLTSQFRIC